MTTKEFRFTLDATSKKFKCPSCGQKTFVRYIDKTTKEYLPDECGRCDRESHCGHHHAPKEYFKGNGMEIPAAPVMVAKEEIKPVNFLPVDLVSQSMNGYQHTHFAKYIISLFGETIGSDILHKYFVGRSRKDNGNANIFWRIDAQERVRTGKIMTYHPETGKRNKDINPTWIHSARRENGERIYPDFNHELCFFGEHLITEYPKKDIALCESEKTAIIASFFLPQFNWLATGGASGCKWREYSVYKVFEGRNVFLFPDFGYYNKTKKTTCYQEWKERADSIMQRMRCNITVSTVLEKNIPESERVNDYDLADMLIKRDDRTGIALKDEYPAIWDYNYEISDKQNTQR